VKKMKDCTVKVFKKSTNSHCDHPPVPDHSATDASSALCKFTKPPRPPPLPWLPLPPSETPSIPIPPRPATPPPASVSSPSHGIAKISSRQLSIESDLQYSMLAPCIVSRMHRECNQSHRMQHQKHLSSVRLSLKKLFLIPILTSGEMTGVHCFPSAVQACSPEYNKVDVRQHITIFQLRRHPTNQRAQVSQNRR
jgi:hypothetical protein